MIKYYFSLIILVIFLFEACVPRENSDIGVPESLTSTESPILKSPPISSYEAKTTVETIDNSSYPFDADWFTVLLDNYNIKDVSDITIITIEAENGKLYTTINLYDSPTVFTIGDYHTMDLSSLCEVENLTLLSLTDLNDLQLCIRGLDTIGSLSSLTGLYCINCGITEFPITTSDSNYPSLAALNLDNNRISDLTSVRLPLNLDNLSLNGNPITDLSPLYTYAETATIQFDGMDLSSPSIAPIDAQKAVLEYFSPVMPPFFNEEEEFYPVFNDENYTYRYAQLCTTHMPSSESFQYYYHSVDLCTEATLAWELCYEIVPLTFFYVWVDADNGNILMYCAELAD